MLLVNLICSYCTAKSDRKGIQPRRQANGWIPGLLTTHQEQVMEQTKFTQASSRYAKADAAALVDDWFRVFNHQVSQRVDQLLICADRVEAHWCWVWR